MHTFMRAKYWMALAVLGAAAALSATAQNKPAAAPIAAPAQEIGETQQQFLKLLRQSPTLTTVLAHDPSLLSDPGYVMRNNPELSRFLALHPEVAQNPDFYLFSKAGPGQREQALVREVWPELVPPERNNDQLREVLLQLQPILIIPAIFVCIGWMFKLFVTSRRQSQIAKMQGEFHARLIEKLGSSQELIAYMETEAGQKFLEAAPMPASADQHTPMPNVVARILTPVQIGGVLTMLGIGLLSIRYANNDTVVPLLILGTILVMPGIGFILSAGITWFLAHKLGLMPAKTAAEPIVVGNDR